MENAPLNNYLRSHRKRTDLLQREVAFLLGYADGTLVSRHELGANLPDLRTALAYEAIFRAPVRELFLGEFGEVEASVRKRAARLIRQVGREAAEGEGSLRLRMLTDIAGEPPLV